MNPTPHQAVELAKATTGRIGALTGGPGTGKTTTAAHYLRQHSDYAACAVAPTGKAAVRLTESLYNSGIKLQARTIHSLLEVDTIENGKWYFKYCRESPLPFHYVLVDESSMIDTPLMADLMAAIPDDGNVIFLGDTNQLSPVGHGAPLRDLIHAGVPHGHLTEIIRNDGGIVEACRAMQADEPWEPGGNLTNYPAPTPEHVVELFKQVTWSNGLNYDECQVLVPTNDCRKEMNELLQRHLNPSADRPGELCVDDRCINTKNGWFGKAGDCSPDAITKDKGRNVYVANGEMGKVVEANKASLVVELQTPLRTVRVPIGDEGASSWQLGYAITVHKSQGSEWPAILVILDGRATRMCDRSWIYTAISRAKKECCLVGDVTLAYQMAANNRIDNRKTFLKELILS